MGIIIQINNLKLKVMSDLGGFIWSILTNKWVIAHNIFCVALMEWSYRKISALYKKSPE